MPPIAFKYTFLNTNFKQKIVPFVCSIKMFSKYFIHEMLYLNVLNVIFKHSFPSGRDILTLVLICLSFVIICFNLVCKTFVKLALWGKH